MGVSIRIDDDLQLFCISQRKLCNYCKVGDAGIKIKAAHPWLVS